MDIQQYVITRDQPNIFEKEKKYKNINCTKGLINQNGVIIAAVCSKGHRYEALGSDMLTLSMKIENCKMCEEIKRETLP
jgi:hypothetical protein